MTKKLYKITRLFIGGTLKGLTHTEITPVHFEVGFVCEKPCGVASSPYVIIAVEEA